MRFVTKYFSIHSNPPLPRWQIGDTGRLLGSDGLAALGEAAQEGIASASQSNAHLLGCVCHTLSTSCSSPPLLSVPRRAVFIVPVKHCESCVPRILIPPPPPAARACPLVFDGRCKYAGHLPRVCYTLPRSGGGIDFSFKFECQAWRGHSPSHSNIQMSGVAGASPSHSYSDVRCGVGLRCLIQFKCQT
jgi:hypothetical protein